jgi:hypothetical protein
LLAPSNPHSVQKEVLPFKPQNPMPQQQDALHQHPPQQQNVKPTTWKRMPHPTDPDSKQAIFRVYGICQDFPQV